ncbi:MAG: ChaN family lipoprotein [Syntrophobacteraceae bacterium]|nr:ChaN family lipoprotein [Desulfobacteraceae bacterium]
MHVQGIRFASFLLPLLLLAGCATFAPRPPSGAEKASTAMSPGDNIDTSNGNILSREALLEELARARIVYAGEMHTSIEDHRVQLNLLKDLHYRNASMVLAMEMLPREAQPVLDRFVRGEIDEEDFVREVHWEKIWGYPFQLYRGLLAFARDNRLKIVGLNAPQEVVHKVAQGGLSSLTPEERARVARDFHLDDPAHREHVRAEFEGHGRGHIKSFETFYEAQLAWEETMSETLARVEKDLPEGGRILAIIGKGHIAGRVGVPALTFLRTNRPFKTVAPIPFDYPGNINDPDIADFVLVVDKYESGHKGRLGVMIREQAAGGGVAVTGVVPGSPAERAGIRKGDVLLSIDGNPVSTLDDIHRALAGGTGSHWFTLKRDGEDISVAVTLGP